MGYKKCSDKRLIKSDMITASNTDWAGSAVVLMDSHAYYERNFIQKDLEIKSLTKALSFKSLKKRNIKKHIKRIK